MDINTRFPAAFVKKPKQSLKYKRSTKRSFRCLPFVAGFHTRSDSPYWHVPAIGGYFGGYETGEAMAQAFLKLLREEDSEFSIYWLVKIIESFMIRFEQTGGQAMRIRCPEDRSDEFNSFRGQYAGFFNLVSQWLKASAKHLGSSFDELTEKELLRRANAGLGFDEEAYFTYLQDRDEE